MKIVESMQSEENADLALEAVLQKEEPSRKRRKLSGNGSSRSEHDRQYFRCYSDLRIHQSMIEDEVRTSAYRWAVLKNCHLFFKKSVLDLGCGTGILSMFCCQAGAQKVYAVDASDIAETAKLVVEANNFENIVEVKRDRIEDITPEKVDIIVSEWMGYCLLHESMLPSFLHARDKWLKKDGLLFPCRVKIFIAPISDTTLLEDEFWDDVKSKYCVNMEPVKQKSRQNVTKIAHVMCVDPHTVQSHASVVCDLDLYQISAESATNVRADVTHYCFGQASITGFALWFSVYFPGGMELSTSPYEAETHWQQTVVYLEQSVPVEQGTELKGSVQLCAAKHNPRCLQVSISCRTASSSTIYQATAEFET